jgi:hypothetical protein
MEMSGFFQLNSKLPQVMIKVFPHNTTPLVFPHFSKKWMDSFHMIGMVKIM